MRRTHLIAGILVVICFARIPSEAAAPITLMPVSEHQTTKIEGWTVNVSEELLANDQAATERALELLKRQLQEIVRVVPEVAVTELRKVPLWFSPEYPGVQPRAEYHPGAGWLKDNKRDPAMARGVEFTDVRNFERETRRMPNFTLHELAHAYHDRVLEDGFGNVRIRESFENAKKQGLYDKVEQRFGDGRSAQVKAYAMSNPMEYFAECTEAFFSTNDFFPFNREQLEKHDPEAVALLNDLWQCDGGAAKKTTAEHKDWTHSGQIWLLTTPEGASLPANAVVENFPVLVRLHQDYFDFSQAQPNGDDLRFFSSHGESLPYQIDDWSPERGAASIWVRIPVIKGNSRQRLTVRWGNSNAASESNGRAVFSESNGFLSVWHMGDDVHDETGLLTTTDSGTTATSGMIGLARHFSGGKGMSAGEDISSYPAGASPHSTEVWFRPERPNTTLIAWGNEEAQGKVVMQYRSPPHVQMDCYFSGGNVTGDSRIPAGEWTQIVHTYQKGESKIYINGTLDGTNLDRDSPLRIRTPAKLWIGGWYNNYDFVGDLDEVRVSSIVRSADWIKLQYENQKPNQSLVGPLVQPGEEFSVSSSTLSVTEGQSATVTVKAGGAQKLVWTLKRGTQESVVAADRFSYTFHAGRVSVSRAGGNSELTSKLTVKAIYPDGVKSNDIAITVSDDIPEPVFDLAAPKNWDGRQTIEVVPQISNLKEMQASGAGNINVSWLLEGVAVIKQVEDGNLVLKRSQGTGLLQVTAAIENGGAQILQTIKIDVNEPSPKDDQWILRPVAETEQPEDHQFIAREGTGREGTREGTLVYAGKLTQQADSVFLRVFADEKLLATETGKLNDDGAYSLSTKLKAELVKYRTEFGLKTGDRETILHQASDIVCGDVYLINGQSNAVATDFGKENPLKPNDWVRTFGATEQGPEGARMQLWAAAEARSERGRSEIGYWGMELGRRLVEDNKIPVCIINGAVGGSRIDQHQRNPKDPTDVATIYGRLLWRVQHARLTHGVRAVIWHQGENDQGADGPTGGYGYETYRQYFIDLAASWKEDFPNIQRYYMFQIWPKSCSMGINGSDNRLREVQRTMPRYFSRLSVMSTLGVKPPGGCHFPAAGYAEFARMLSPLINYQIYHRFVDGRITPPNLKRVYFANDRRDELILEFDQHTVWSKALASEFYLDGKSDLVESGSANATTITLKLKQPSAATTITYLDSDRWNPDNILYSQNGLAALTFCDVPIEVSGTP